MNIVYIMRGVPGSGKTTIAKSLSGEAGIIHSTDNYFMQDGVYHFDPSLLAENHQKNFQAFCESLSRKIPVIICDNTNVKREHWTPYARAAEHAGYLVAVVTMPHPYPAVAAKRNTHGVPEYDITKMLQIWEP